MYRIHLERESLFIKKDGKITLGQILSCARKDKDMFYTKSIIYKSSFGEKITRGGHYLLWKEKSAERDIYFQFINGVLSVEYSPETLKKLKEWSKPLRAYIYGDVGEEY